MPKKRGKASRSSAKKRVAKNVVVKKHIKKKVTKHVNRKSNQIKKVQEEVVAVPSVNYDRNPDAVVVQPSITNSQEFLGQPNSEEVQSVSTENPSETVQQVQEQEINEDIITSENPPASEINQENNQNSNPPRMIELGSVGELPMDEIIPQQNKKSSLLIWVILSIILLLIIFGTLAYFIFFKS